MANKFSAPLTLGGVAVVCCVHDREKRQVTTIEQVVLLGRGLYPPVIYNPKVHFVNRCACCENLFVALHDTPKFCNLCEHTPLVHNLGGPLAPPSEPWKE